MRIRGYYFITDAALSRQGIMKDAADALAAGAAVVQYRNKTAPTRQAYTEAAQLRVLCRNALLIINDRIDLALAVDADGVHLGQDDLPVPAARKIFGRKRVIGVTVHTLAQATAAQAAGADYIGVSPVFPTMTKRDAGAAVGLELLALIKKNVALPLVAIGGITLANAPAVIAAGADAVCALSAVLRTDNVHSAVADFQALFR
ncbi:MAG: thiamine phosphate synthase [Candidatus Omnitrophica bacterium]|nr:thiamine phosphate synthase [Candidatus Omnitrophota bacterium]